MHTTSGANYVCCGRRFESKASLRQHTGRCHRDGYRCHECGRSFCRKALLKRHRSVHTGVKEHACDICHYATSHKGNLERHRRVHTKRREVRKQHTSALFRPMDSNPPTTTTYLMTSSAQEYERAGTTWRRPLPVNRAELPVKTRRAIVTSYPPVDGTLSPMQFSHVTALASMLDRRPPMAPPATVPNSLAPLPGHAYFNGHVTSLAPPPSFSQLWQHCPMCVRFHSILSASYRLSP